MTIEILFIALLLMAVGFLVMAFVQADKAWEAEKQAKELKRQLDMIEFDVYCRFRKVQPSEDEVFAAGWNMGLETILGTIYRTSQERREKNRS